MNHHRASQLALVFLTAGCASAPPKDPGLVRIEVAPANTYVTADAPAEMIVRVRVASDALPSADRGVLGLALVMDTSGSMEGPAIEAAKRAAEALIDALADGDRLSIVAFHSTAELILEPVVIDADSRAEAKKRVSSIRAMGTTDLARGIELGLEQLEAHLDRAKLHRLLLLSDGVPNDASALGSLVQRAKQQSISITALGLGLEYDETLLSHLARETGGKFQFIEDATQVAQVFEQHLLRFERLTAKNLVLKLVAGPAVTVGEVVGHTPSQNGRTLHVPLGDLGDRERREVMVRLTVQGRKDGAKVELLDAVLTFDDAAGAGALERRSFVAVEATADGAKLGAGRNPEVEASAAEAAAAAAVIDAIALARSGRGEEASARLAAGIARAEAELQKRPHPALEAQLAGMAQVQQAIPKLVEEASRLPVVQDQAYRDAQWNVRSNHAKASSRLY